MDRITRRRVLATGAAALATGIAGCSGDGGDGGGGNDGTTQGNTVEMTGDFAFDPESISVSTGATVTWENVGNVAHTVTAYADRIPDGADYWASGGAKSEQAARNNYPPKGEIGSGGTYEHAFETAGTHEYFCIPHEDAGMKGTVEVG